MATLYAKAAGGNWSAAGTWSNVSSLGVDNSGPPTSGDDVIFSSGSGNVTIDAAAACRSADFSGAGVSSYTGTLTHNSGITLSIGDGTAGTGNLALTLVAGMTYTLGNATSSAVSFVSTSSTQQTITWAGKTTGDTTFNGAGGSWLFGDNHTSTGALTFTAGILNTNGKTCSWGTFVSSGSGTRTMTCGASSITLTGTSTAFNVSNTNLTLTANTSTWTFSGASPGPSGTWASGNWNGASVVVTGSGNFIIGNTWIVANFTRTGTAAKTELTRHSSALTCTGTYTIGGNSTQGVNRMLVDSGTVGTSRTITAAAYVITGDVDFMDINLAYSGAASWTNAGSAYIGDALGNSGAVTTNATVAATQTATGTASFTWSTHGWTSRVPLPQDDVVINNAFSGGRTITSDMPRIGKSVDASACTGTPTLSLSVAPTLYGGLQLAAGMTLSGAVQTTFNGRSGSFVLNYNAVALSGNVRINFSNTWTVFDLECTTARTVTLPASGTQTITSSVTLAGASGQNLSLVSSSPGTSTTLSGLGATWSINGFVTRSADILTLGASPSASASPSSSISLSPSSSVSSSVSLSPSASPSASASSSPSPSESADMGYYLRSRRSS